MPRSILTIPIRKVGSNRIEIILPNADAAEVDEVKRRMTDVGSLEFRILASMKKDKAAIEYEEFLKKKPDYPDRKRLEKYISENKKP